MHAIDYWHGANVKCGRHGMTSSVMETQSHDESRVEEVQEEFTGVHCLTVFNNVYSSFSGMGM